MAMLRVLCDLAPNPLQSLTVAHIDHGLRPESAEDAAFVESVAVNTGIPFVSIKMSGARSPSGMSPEDFWRRERYRLLKLVQKHTDSTAIATAHTATDHLETLLLRISSGTGPRGFLGIRLKREDNVIRPMLQVTRNDIAGFAEKSGLQWRDDISNYDSRHPRNAMRKYVIPVMRELNPSVESSSVISSSLLADEDSYISRQALSVLKNASWNQTLPSKLAASVFQAADNVIIKRCATALYHDLDPHHRLVKTHVMHLVDCLIGKRSHCQLSGGHHAWYNKNDNSIYLVPFVSDEECNRIISLQTHSDAEFVVGAFTICIKTVVEQTDSDCLVTDKESFIRTRRPKDIWFDKNTESEIRLSEYFRIKHIFPKLRSYLPMLVCGQNRVLWVANPYSKSECFIFLCKNTCIRLTCKPLSAIN